MRLALLTFALLHLTSAPGLLAQDAGARGSIELHAGASSVAGDAGGIAGGRLWLELGPRWSLGASGTFALAPATGGELEGSGLEADLGYGGAVLAFHPGWFEGVELHLQGGVGSVSLRDRTVGTTVDTEAFWVLEPAVAWTSWRHGAFRGGATAGYRAVFGAADLTRIDSSDLRSFTLSLFFRLSPF